MKYLILAFALLGCSEKISVTPEQISECKRLAELTETKYEISDKGSCILKKTVYTATYEYYIPIDQIDGALRIAHLQSDMIRAPLLHSCMDKCIIKAPKPVCPGDNSYERQKCALKCDDEVPQ